MSLVFYIIGNIFHIYAIYKFSNVFFKKQEVNKYLEFGIYVIYFIINTIMYLKFENFIVNIATNVISFFAITFLYKSGISRKIISTILIYAVSMVCDASMLAFSRFTGLDSLIFSQGIASSLLVFILALVLKHLTDVKSVEHNIKVNAVYLITIFMIPLSSIIIGQLSMKEFNLSTIVIVALLMLVNFIVFFLYDQLLKMFNEKHNAELINQINAEYKNQLEIMYQSQSRIRFLKHDIRNHIYKMQNLLSENKLKELEEYFSETQEYIKIQNLYVSSGNSDIDSLLNYKLYQAENIGVKFETEIKLPEQIEINSFDLNIVIGNLLDNAIEALNKTENKNLEIIIKYNKGVINIKIKNTFDGIVLNNLLTRKESKDNHGLGLLSIQNVLDKYNGLLKTQYDDKWFEASVIMYES